MIHKLKHGGKELPIKIGYGAMLQMQEETGLSMKDLNAGKMELKHMESLFYFSLKSGHAAQDEPFSISRDKSMVIWEDSIEEFNAMMAKSFQSAKKK